jgi:hypothetical protein
MALPFAIKAEAPLFDRCWDAGTPGNDRPETASAIYKCWEDDRHDEEESRSDDRNIFQPGSGHTDLAGMDPATNASNRIQENTIAFSTEGGIYDEGEISQRNTLEEGQDDQSSDAFSSMTSSSRSEQVDLDVDTKSAHGSANDDMALCFGNNVDAPLDVDSQNAEGNDDLDSLFNFDTDDEDNGDMAHPNDRGTIPNSLEDNHYDHGEIQSMESSEAQVCHGNDDEVPGSNMATYPDLSISTKETLRNIRRATTSFNQTPQTKDMHQQPPLTLKHLP